MRRPAPQAPGGTTQDRSLLLHVDDREELLAAADVYFDVVARAGAHEGAADRGPIGDVAFGGVDLVRADQAVRLLGPGFVANRYVLADAYRVSRVDGDLGVAHDVLELRDLPLEAPLIFFRLVVGAVLRQVAI